MTTGEAWVLFNDFILMHQEIAKRDGLSNISSIEQQWSYQDSTAAHSGKSLYCKPVLQNLLCGML
jgi:hypothetical protein